MSEQKTSPRFVRAIGRRKSAVAEVRIMAGTGKISVNNTAVTTEPDYLSPLKLAGKFGSTDLSIQVKGGGFNGQNDAIRHGISRALLLMDEELRTTLKKAGFLTRDPRERERKKFGLKSARRSPQWSKR